MSMSWKTLLGRTAAVSGLAGVMVALGVVVGVRIAKADPGGPTRPSLTFAGVLRNDDGSAPARTASLTFLFTRADGATCAPSAVRASIATGGAFSVLVPIDGCASTFFDGSNISYTVAEGATMLTTVPALVTPVPYARFADQAGVNNDCPVGYSRTTETMYVVCRHPVGRGVVDEVVKVGTGASAFWIDRYEASVWDQLGVQRGFPGASVGYTELANNGQWTTGSRGALAAYSHGGVQPSVNVTWFQAVALCRASGKRLITREEWFSSADGLTAIDPITGIDGSAHGETRCNTGGRTSRSTGLGTACTSSWGVQDMIGNVWEWTDEWYANVGALTALPPTVASSPALPSVSGRRVGEVSPWPLDYGSDTTVNITSVVQNFADNQIGSPGAARRGGNWGSAAGGGVFALSLDIGPADGYSGLGFRCVISR